MKNYIKPNILFEEIKVENIMDTSNITNGGEYKDDFEWNGTIH